MLNKEPKSNSHKDVSPVQAEPNEKKNNPSVSQTTPQNNFSAESEEKKEISPAQKNHFPVFFGFVIVFVTLFGLGGVYAYWNGLDIPFGRKTPEEVLSKMIENMRELRAFSHHSTFSFDIEARDVSGGGVFSNGSMKAKGTYKLAGGIDTLDPKNTNAQVNVDLSLNARFGLFSIDIAGDADIRALGDNFYIRLNNISDLGFVDLSPLKNKWIHITLADFGFSKEAIQMATDRKAMLNDNINTVFYDNFPFSVSEEFPDETINKTKTYHYRLKVDEEKLKRILSELPNLVRAENFGNDGQYILDEKSELDMIFEENVKPYLSRFDSEIWIGKKDFWLHKATLSFPVDIAEDGMSFDMKFTFHSLLSGHNLPLMISPPDNVISLEESIEIFEAVSKTGGGGLVPVGARKKGRDAKRISDIKQLQASLELYYDSCGRYPITRGKMVWVSTLEEGGCSGLGDFFSPLPVNPSPGGIGYTYCNTASLESKVCHASVGEGYKISFELETGTGSLTQGPYIATPSGIESILLKENVHEVEDGNLSCVDSDGKDPFTKGYVIYNNEQEYDYCTGTNQQVFDLWCYESGGKMVKGRQGFDCADGCIDGACRVVGESPQVSSATYAECRDQAGTWVNGMCVNPGLAIVSPNDLRKICLGDTLPIRWKGLPDLKAVEIWAGFPGQTPYVIGQSLATVPKETGESTPGEGTFLWKIGDTKGKLGTDKDTVLSPGIYEIRIRSLYNNKYISDTSDSVLTILDCEG